MYVRLLELVDFRSYPGTVVEFGPGCSVLVGPNGAGKTNLVEALGYVATLGSHRVAADGPLVRAGASTAVIRCAIVHDGRELLVEMAIEPGRGNRVRLGRSSLSRARDVLGALRLVLFAPEDLSVVRGDPAERRRYLDDLLVARQPRYAGVRADYERVVKQRNALLRTAYLARRAGGRPGDLSTLDVWDEHLTEHGAALLAGRLELCAALAPHVAKAYDAVAAGRGAAAVSYRSGFGEAESIAPDRGVLRSRLAAAVRESRPAEIERGVTLVGPHRDDLALALGPLPVRGYASQGEAWSFALALRLAAYDLLRAEGVQPVLVLDDVFAELDVGRRERLAELVAGAAQVFVTCAVEEDVPQALRGVRYTVSEGEVHRA